MRLLGEEGAYFGKTSAGWFFGFKLHVLRDISGCIIDAILTSGKLDDRGPSHYLAQAVDGGILLGDLGNEGPKRADLLADEAELLLITRRDVAKKRELHSSVRQQIAVHGKGCGTQSS